MQVAISDEFLDNTKIVGLIGQIESTTRHPLTTQGTE